MPGEWSRTAPASPEKFPGGGPRRMNLCGFSSPRAGTLFLGYDATPTGPLGPVNVVRGCLGVGAPAQKVPSRILNLVAPPCD